MSDRTECPKCGHLNSLTRVTCKSCKINLREAFDNEGQQKPSKATHWGCIIWVPAGIVSMVIMYLLLPSIADLTGFEISKLQPIAIIIPVIIAKVTNEFLKNQIPARLASTQEQKRRIQEKQSKRTTFENLIASIVFFISFFLSLAINFAIFLALVYFVRMVSLYVNPDGGSDFQRSESAFILYAVIWSGLILIFYLRFFLGRHKVAQLGYPLKDNQFWEIEQLISDVATDLNVRQPDQIYFSPFPEAAAYEQTLFSGKKQFLLIGWPLLYELSLSELKAIVAHELAHFDNHAFVASNAIWRVNSLIDLTEGLYKAESQKDNHSFSPYYWVTMLQMATFVPIYRLASRKLLYHYEFYCDKRGALQYGSNVFSEALNKAVKLNIAFKKLIEKDNSRISYDFFKRVQSYYHDLQNSEEFENEFMKQLDIDGAEHPSLAKRQAAISEYPEMLSIDEPLLISPDEMDSLGNDVLNYFTEI